MFKKLVFYSITLFNLSLAAEPSTAQIKTLYNSLPPQSISQHLAFYDLYKNTPEGQQALAHAWKLLAGKNAQAPSQIGSDPFLTSVIHSIVTLVNKPSDAPLPELSEAELNVIEKLGSHLPNRKLRGYNAKNESEVLQLAPEQIDLSRGLFLTQLGPDDMRKIRTYEALIDLMALQMMAQLPQNATPAAKIRVMNDFIFGEMGFRFPPHSIHAKNIDLYTFLPSVLDSRRGVCLGVSILYICLAQRLSLPLEMITPPGHIYVRYRDNKEEINIETTARGIHIDSPEYLSIETRSLQLRTIKEVIGMAHYNQASVYWGQEKFAEARASYEKAFPYMPSDTLLIELMAYSYLLTGSEEEAKKMLDKVKDHIPDYAVSANTITTDILEGKIDGEGMKTILMDVDETRESILKKQKALQQVLEKFPQFRAGLMALATTWLQLHRHGEALEVLQRYHKLFDQDPTVEYYLTILLAERMDYNKAWEHLKNTETILAKKSHYPKALKELRRGLSCQCPE